MSWKWFSKEAGQIKSTNAGRTLANAKRDVKRKDEVKAKRQQKQGGKK